MGERKRESQFIPIVTSIFTVRTFVLNAYTLDLVQVMNPASISFDIRTEGILRFPTDGVFILSRTVKLNEVALLVVIYKMQNLVFFSD